MRLDEWSTELTIDFAWSQKRTAGKGYNMITLTLAELPQFVPSTYILHTTSIVNLNHPSGFSGELLWILVQYPISLSL